MLSMLNSKGACRGEVLEGFCQDQGCQEEREAETEEDVRGGP